MWAYGLVQGPIIFLACIFCLLLGCVSAPQAYCTASEKRLVNDMLYFGTDKPNGILTPQEWEKFLRTVITPRFPKGLTYWLASGQWQNSKGIAIQEKTWVLSLVHPEDEQSETDIRTFISDYKNQFNQEAVLRVKGYACVEN